ncbi:MAG: hypothetical protein MUF34_11885, partial [Polyangiaceae bacterium]|nr:hypothetical protein [Polyangiaceae bacterium]
MNHYRQLLAGVGLAILGFSAGCVDAGVSLGNDGGGAGNAAGGGAGAGGAAGSAASGGGGAASGASGAAGGGGEVEARASLSAAEVLALLQADFATPGGAREGVRYVSLHTFYNEASFSDDQVRGAADAVSKLLNHLATTQVGVKRPTPVGPAGGPPVALRFELRDYDLTATDWEIIERGANVLSRGGPCAVPVITAEQFLAAASSDQNFVVSTETFESVYSNITLRRVLQSAGTLPPDQLVFNPISKVDFINNYANISNVSLYDVATAFGVDLQAETQAAAAGTSG